MSELFQGGKAFGSDATRARCSVTLMPGRRYLTTSLLGAVISSRISIWDVCGRSMVKVTAEFSGGLEILFGNQSSTAVEVAPKQPPELTLGELLLWLRDNLLTERPELFLQGSTVRPGILVLVNDVDWELSGMSDTILEEGDIVVFISTLHGG